MFFISKDFTRLEKADYPLANNYHDCDWYKFEAVPMWEVAQTINTASLSEEPKWEVQTSTQPVPPKYLSFINNSLERKSDSEIARVDEEELDKLRNGQIAIVSKASFDEVEAIYPQYQQRNAALGIYDAVKTQAIKDKITDCREKFYALKDQILVAKKEQVKEIKW